MFYSQVQGDNMKNTSLFMMFTLLGVPGFVTAANSDLANAEYNFAVNELSRSSLNQAAIIGQQGVLMTLRFARKVLNSVHCFPGWGRQQSES
jgi:minor curlin subunit